MKCRLKDRDDPYFKLNPIFIEDLHLNPEILLFHDVLSKNEVDTVKEVAGPLVRYILILNFLIMYVFNINSKMIPLSNSNAFP